MANTNQITRTLIAGIDLSAKQYTFTKTSTAAAKTVLGATVAGELVTGVVCNKPTLGAPAEVALINAGGIGKITLGATLAIGAQVQTDATGKAIAATSTKFILGEILEAGVSGDVVSWLPYFGGIKP